MTSPGGYGHADVVDRLNRALQGRYAIASNIGEGGMATVYLADDLKHERRVALKVSRIVVVLDWFDVIRERLDAAGGR